MRVKVWARKLWRKISALYARVSYKNKNTSVPKEVVSSDDLIIQVPVLEVMVPALINNDWSQVYLSGSLLDELKYWIDELKIVHEITDIRFKVADRFSQIGWDSVTGLNGRVVTIEVYGTKVTRKDILERISTATVELHEAIMIEEPTEESEIKKLRAVQKVRELLEERGNRYGNVRNDVKTKL